jgi:hypothetical protein
VVVEQVAVWWSGSEKQWGKKTSGKEKKERKIRKH